MNIAKKIIAILLLVCPITILVASNNECMDGLKKILSANKNLKFTEGKYYKLEYTQISKYRNTKNKKQITINDKCLIVFNENEVYFKNKDLEYFKTKKKVVCIDHSEQVIFISDLYSQVSSKYKQTQMLLADSIISSSKIESCQNVKNSNNLFSISMIPDKNIQLKIGGISRFSFVYDTSSLKLLEYHVSYNSANNKMESVDYSFTKWYEPVDKKSIVDLVSYLKNNKLMKLYPNYKIKNNSKK